METFPIVILTPEGGIQRFQVADVLERLRVQPWPQQNPARGRSLWPLNCKIRHRIYAPEY